MEKQTSELYHLYQLASQGDVDAQYRLGMRYLNGIGTSQNIRLAYIWIGKAADGNHPQAKQDILHLRTAGIEAAAISAGIPTHIDSHSIVPAPEGYPQKVLAALDQSDAVPASPEMPAPCKEHYLTLELFGGTAELPSSLLRKVDVSARYWRNYL